MIRRFFGNKGPHRETGSTRTSSQATQPVDPSKVPEKLSAEEPHCHEGAHSSDLAESMGILESVVAEVLPSSALRSSSPQTRDSFEIRVRHVRGHWIAQASPPTVSRNAGEALGKGRLYAGLGLTLSQCLSELARHMEDGVALDDLSPPSTETEVIVSPERQPN